MDWQLRVYTIAEGALDEFVREWREHVAPLRRRFGFQVAGPWIDRGASTFVWAVGYGRADGFEEANRSYYESGERRSVDPDPGRHVVTQETRMLAEAPGAPPRLFRVIVPVADIDAATAFYSTLLAIDGNRVSAGRHYFDCGGTILACFDALREDGRELPPNPDHVYLSVDDLEGARRRAAAAGAALRGEIETRPWGERSFYLTDPFGNALCFVETGTEFTGAWFVE